MIKSLTNQELLLIWDDCSCDPIAFGKAVAAKTLQAVNSSKRLVGVDGTTNPEEYLDWDDFDSTIRSFVDGSVISSENDVL